MNAFNLMRRVVLGYLHLAQGQQCVIGNLPVPLGRSHLLRRSTGNWAAQ